jgi:hypothetical protein
MKPALHLIIDDRDAHLRLFWRRHGLKILEQLVPSELSFLRAHVSLEQELRRALPRSDARLILLGSPAMLGRAFNTLMQLHEERPHQREVGFWELRKREAYLSLFQSSERFRPLLHTFRNGHSVPVNVIKARYTNTHEQLATAYFWNELHVYAAGNPSHSMLSMGEEEWTHEGKVRYRLTLHHEPLHSWRINHSNLLKANYLQAYASAAASPRTGSSKPRRQNAREFWLSKGETLQLRGNFLRMSEPNAGWLADTQQLQLEVLPRCMHLLIPMMPVRTAEPARRGTLLDFKPRKLVAVNRQKPAQDTHQQSSNEPLDNFFADDSNQP